MKKAFFVILISANQALTFAAPRVNSASLPRRPPEGIPIPQEIKAKLEKETAELGREIDQWISADTGKAELVELLPDVEIFQKAVRYAIEDNIFYKPDDFAAASRLLAEGKERLRLLREGKAPWTTATGLVVRGYRSKVDGSVQPYGLVVPVSYQAGTGKAHRLDLWFHGRNDKLSELSFITERERSRGEFTPENTFVQHPYGRYCNAFKFAGETDVFEAMNHVRKHYPIDQDRISVRGFSMGGAAAWHLAVHHASLWAAASPGAGFADTFIFQNGAHWPTPHPWYEQRLWHLYDATDYAANLFNCPVVAYSGEIDGQRQAAELMSRAMEDEGLDLIHIIGPNTGHQFERVAKAEVGRRIDALVAKGRDVTPHKVRFTTWTLRYNQMAWVTVDAMERHWNRARVEAEITGGDSIEVSTTNVAAMTLSMPAGRCPLKSESRPKLRIDGQDLIAPTVSGDAWTARFQKRGSHWQPVRSFSNNTLRKRHGLQGPIDDAFMDSFIIVRPTGKPMNEALGRWTADAMGQAIKDWRLQFRGQPRLADDTAVTPADIATNNLILFGDPQSNRLLGQIMAQLPLAWDSKGLHLHGKTYRQHVPLMIYPNPLNPNRYVVLNSGFTFADAAPTSNALQIPELPDYAVLDVKTQDVIDAGFFDEKWALPLLGQ